MPKEVIWANVQNFSREELEHLKELPESTLHKEVQIAFLNELFNELEERDSRTVQFRISVGWGKDCEHVQLGICGWDHDKGVAVDVPGFYINLSWSALNQLVRVVRRARDQAYGRPE